MFTNKTTRRTRLNPGKTTLYLTEVADTFRLKTNTIRQYLPRGKFPEPTVRREPELGWNAADIYRWAYKTKRLPLDAIPFRYLTQLTADGTLPGPQVPHVRHVTCRTHGGSTEGFGISVRYGGMTSADIGFTLFYPDEYGRAGLDPNCADILVTVTGHVSSGGGFYVDVEQTHPDYEYVMDTEFFTCDVAQLIQEPIPYWPLALRTSFGGVDRRTGHVLRVDSATATPSRFLDGRNDAAETFAAEHPEERHRDLVTALRAEVADDYRQSAKFTQQHIADYVEPHQADDWALHDLDKHLFLAATPAILPAETAEEEFARIRLNDLMWEVPVGDSPSSRQAAKRFFNTSTENVFFTRDETQAQKAFREGLTRVPEGEATLAHLAFTHPLLGQGPDADSVPRDYWKDADSGALATRFHAVRGRAPEYVLYVVPVTYAGPVTVESFDFEEEHQPFVWTHDGNSVPLPRHKDSGYALGYDGSGPRAIKESAAQLLGLSAKTKAGPRWPFFKEGYPTRVAASEMLSFYAFYDDGAEW